MPDPIKGEIDEILIWLPDYKYDNIYSNLLGWSPLHMSAYATVQHLSLKLFFSVATITKNVTRVSTYANLYLDRYYFKPMTWI